MEEAISVPPAVRIIYFIRNSKLHLCFTTERQLYPIYILILSVRIDILFIFLNLGQVGRHRGKNGKNNVVGRRERLDSGIQNLQRDREGRGGGELWVTDLRGGWVSPQIT